MSLFGPIAASGTARHRYRVRICDIAIAMTTKRQTLGRRRGVAFLA